MIGRWLFARRGWLPVPLVAGMLLLPPRHWLVGGAVMALGEAVRLAAVGHIGAPSRTRGDDVGPLVRDGPYGWVRNPLYVGNLVLWAGLGVVLWPAALVAVPALALYYAAIVRWEERNLVERVGAPYAAYLREVPRWLPRRPSRVSWRWDARRALRAERGTLVTIAVVLALTAARGALS